MKKQTAVEWLVKEIKSKYSDIDFYHIKKEIDQAKAMEKKQIMDAIYDNMGTNFDPNMGRAEQYYNEIYNK